jgi:hypothetical protein
MVESISLRRTGVLTWLRVCSMARESIEPRSSERGILEDLRKPANSSS